MEQKAQLLLVLGLFLLPAACNSQNSCSNAMGCFPREEKLFSQGSKYPLRSVNVTSTCPNGQTFKTVQTSDNKTYTCSSNDLQASNMLDKVTKQIQIPSSMTVKVPNFETYWMSKIPPSNEAITLNLTNVFLINKISISFISPHADPNTVSDSRPKSLAIEKFDDKSKSWSGLLYVAEKCGDFPNVAPLPAVGANYDASAVYCKESQFGGDKKSQLTGNIQKVDFHPSLDFSNEFYMSPKVQRHFMTSSLRVRLVKPALTEALRNYFAVADVSVLGTCACFGHAASCTGPNNDQCVCGHNTEGAHCEKCKPLYNNRTWQMGTNEAANECQACNCNNHAASCHFDESKGYGVCDSCVNNTQGENCNQCKTGFYVNPLLLPGSKDKPQTGKCSGYAGVQLTEYDCSSYCIPCNCNGSGTDPKDNYMCKSQTGQCLCKQNVMGTKCDECKDTFWGLTNSLLGCQSCSCNAFGSFNSTNFCDKVTGNCVCKSNVQGQKCDKCKPGSYNLQSSNVVDGCTLCGCDPGGAVNLECSDTGVCTCKPNVIGRTCNQTAPNTYIPKLDHFTFDVEFQNKDGLKEVQIPGHGQKVTGRGVLELTPDKKMTVNISVPVTHTYDIVIRYQMKVMSAALNGQIIQVAGVAYECEGKQYTAQQTWPITGISLAGMTDSGSAVIGSLCMKATQNYTLTFSVASLCLIDSIILLPKLESLSVYKAADAASKDHMKKCWEASKPVNPSQRNSLNCSSVEFSLMADLFGKALPCSCSADGTKPNTVCDSFGGQCQCKDNVILRECSICRVDSFGQNVKDGCAACHCNLGGSVKAVCNESGFCECHPNVIGMKCDSCLPNYFGLSKGTGCIKCECNSEYSFNNSCADNGQCACKPGVSGLLCTQCADGFFNLTNEGCSPCKCDVNGSTSLVCNKVTGVCPCKSATTGQKCSQCKPGYFGLGPWSKDGCLKCFCSGKSEKCYSAPGWYLNTTVSLWTLKSSNAVDERWKGEDDGGNVVQVTESIVLAIVPPRYVMRILNTGDSLQRTHCYFVAPSKFLGNKQSSYGLNLSFSLRVSSNLTTVDNRSNGDVIMKGKDTNFKLVKELPVLPYNVNATPISFNFVMREDQWFVDSTKGKKATYADFMKTLANLEYLKIRGKFNNETGSYTDLYEVKLEHASQEGTTPINTVEQCNCPAQFQGQHCEKCAKGNKRPTPSSGQFDTCVPCECNGHEGGPCDPQTGVCQCVHYTTGDQCEKCLPGYYGNALAKTPDACKPCMCPGNVVTKEVNAFAKTCEQTSANGFVCQNCSTGHTGTRCEVCQKNYYGVPEDPKNNNGKCQPCVCHGRADTCNSTTGECIDCKLNTAGKNCHICAPSYFGNAMTDTCKPCNCKASVGSTGECDHSTGQCLCRPNVVGYKCDRCVAFAYNYSSGVGCTMCNCSAVGAIGQQCDAKTGQCTCRRYVVGRQCDSCASQFWHLNLNTGCDACNCDANGAADTTPFGICDLTTGQCTCSSEAIVGRRCNQCSKISKKSYTFVKTFEVGNFPHCVYCGECFDNWAGQIENIYKDLVQLDAKAKTIWTHYENSDAVAVKSDLQQIKTNIANAEAAIGKTENISMTLNLLHLDLQKVLAKANALDKELDLLQKNQMQTQNGLSNSSSFVGVFTTNSGVILSQTQLVDKVNALKNTIEASYKSGNSSWTKIKSLSFLVGSADESTKLLKNRVNTAMLVLSMAMTTFNSAKTIYEQTYLNGFKNNENAINMGMNAAAKATEELNRIKTVLAKITQQNRQANVTMASVMLLSGQKKTQVEEALKQSVYAKGNATVAAGAAQEAEAALTVFKTEADKAKNDLTSAFKKVIESSASLQEISKQMSNISTLVNSVLNTQLRPLTDMQKLANEIKNTQVSNTGVTATNEKAKQALATAKQSLNDTQKAMDDSQKALGQVQGIQDNLVQAEKLRSDAKQLKQEADSFNSTINSAVTKLQTKVTNANNLSISTSTGIASVISTVSQVKQCFTDKDAAATAAVNDADAVLKDAQSTTQSQSQAGSLVTQVSEEITKKDFSTSLKNIDNANLQLASVSNQFKTVETVADLVELLREYQRQREEMIKLQNELQVQESQLDVLLQSLQLSSQTSTCATN